MRLQRSIILTVLLLLLTINLFADGSLQQNKLFPIPDNLKPNVKFWINVYAKYSRNQIAIHDNLRLDIIYEVVDANDLFPNHNYSDKKLWKRIDAIKDEYRDILRKFAITQIKYPESLPEKEQRIYKLFKNKNSSAEFSAAIKRIRGQQGLKEHFKAGISRSGKYLKYITEIYKKYKLPAELAALPHVESSFDYHAYSKMGAAGLWQFTRSTGRRYMKINYTVDERFDPEKATVASAKLLKNNYKILGTWPLAITAYNHGPNGMKRAVKKCGTKDIGVIVKKYSSRQFKFASRNFYAEFLAALHVSRNYKIYFGEIQLETPQKYLELKIPYFIKVSSLAKKLNLKVADIKEYNPSLRKSVITSRRRLPKGFKLRIPWRDDFDTDSFLAEIKGSEKFDEQVKPSWYKVQRGDNLEKIARINNTSLDNLLALNDDIDDIHTIYAGQILRVSLQEKKEIPITKKVIASDTKPIVTSPKKQEVKQIKHPEKIELLVEKKVTKSSIKLDEKLVLSKDYRGEHLVKSGENLEKIASLYNLKVADLLDINNVNDKNKIAVGQMLIIPDVKDKTVSTPTIQLASSEVIPKEKLIVKQLEIKEKPEKFEPHYNTILVMPEETLGHYADWLEIRTQELRYINNFRYGRDIHLNQTIRLKFSEVSYKEFTRRRMEYHRALREDFFASYRVDSVQTHLLKNGESLWYLCNEVYEVPYWLLIKYNPELDTNTLRKGDKIVIPVVNSSSEG